MAITNVVSNSSKLFKDIVVINKTNMSLKNLHLSYEGLERPIFKIYNLPKGQQVKKSLLIDYLEKPTKLLLVCNSNTDKEESILAYDSISRDDLSTLILKINNDGDSLFVNYIVENNKDESH